jgi:type I restriction enzyme S subunit
MSKTFNKDVLSSFFEEVLDYRGKTPKKLNSDWTDKGYRAISANNVKTNGLQKLDSIRYVDQTTYDKWMKIEIERGDLLLTSEAPAGEVMIWDSDEKIVLSQRLFGLRVNDRVYNKYLKYYLQSDLGQKEILRNTSGSTVFGISAKMFDLINVHYPEKKAQILIGDLLSDLDAKIEVNNKINAELEALAKTIYDYWFVQFDFPDQNGKPYKSSGGKMVYNEVLKREIPEGWEKGVLDDIAKIVRGVSYNKHDIKTPNDENVTPVLRATNITGNVIDLENMVYVPDEFVSEKQLMNKYDVLITMSSGSKDHIGKNGMFYFDKKVAFGAFCAKLEAKENFQFFLSSYMQSEFISETIKKECLGTSINNLNGSLVKNFRLVKPSEDVLKSFNIKMKPIHDKIGNNQKENQKLAALRDWLLPMLMNGQVTVRSSDEVREQDKEILNQVQDNKLGRVAEDEEEYKVNK